MKQGIPAHRFRSLFVGTLLLCALAWPLAGTAGAQVEFGAEDDISVFGVDGTAPDPDAEIKGFSVFGATQTAYTGITAGRGNVVVNGVLAVSSGAYFAASSTFTAASKIYINDGSAGQLLSRNSDGSLQWASSGALGDNLGNHTATQNLAMGANQISGTGSVTMSSYTATGIGFYGPQIAFSNGRIQISSETNTAVGGGVRVSTNVYIVGFASATNVYANYFYGNGANLTGISGDNLGNHTATQSLGMGAYQLSGTGALTMSSVTASGIGFYGPQFQLATAPNVKISSEASAALGGGVRVSTNVYIVGFASATNVYANYFYGNGANLTGISGDNLGNHTATQALQMGAYGVNTSSDITAARYQINGSTMVAILPGMDNIAYGVNAGSSTTGGSGNIFIGNSAGASNTTGLQNTANGYKALYSNTTGGFNVANGYAALYLNTTGADNTANGLFALFYNTTGRYNTANGRTALYYNTTGLGNTANGVAALQYNQTGSQNTVSGLSAGGYGAGAANSFSSSTIMGAGAGYNLTTGSDNTFYGWQAGYNVTSGAGNIVIGYDQRTPATTTNDFLNVGGLVYGDLAAKTIGISTRVPYAALDVVSTGTLQTQFAQIWRDGNGVIVGSMSATGVLMATKVIGATGSGDNLGNHTATQNLNLANYSATSVASMTMVGKGLQIGTDLTTSANGIFISTAGSIMTLGLGDGTALPNARGIGAVDLQTSRTATTQVAEGVYATISGGANNRASGVTYATVGGGGNNLASGAYTTVGGGFYNTASGNAATVPGGYQCIASGGTSFAAGYGANSTAAGTFTWGDNLSDDVVNSVANRTFFKSSGGFLVTGSTNTHMTGTLNRGMLISGNGLVGISTGVPYAALDVVSTGTLQTQFAQIWRDGGGVIVGSMSATGVLMATKFIGATGSGDNLGNHTATQVLQMGAYGVNTSSNITAARYQINGSTMVAILPGTNSIAYGVYAGTSNINGGSTNVFIGNYAGTANTLGSNNTANGANALYSNTTGSNNTANGANALYSNTTSNNTANGYYALYSNTIGTSNTANGYFALATNTTGNYNTANGVEALRNNTTGSNNTANGLYALRSNTTGSNNTANGFYALYANTTGSYNTANGADALRFNTTGSNNTANGNYALYRNTTGSQNTVSGYQAGGAGVGVPTAFSSSTIMGAQAGYMLTTDSSANTFLGWQAGYATSDGGQNTFVGNAAGHNNGSGWNNTFVGGDAGYTNDWGQRNTFLGSAAGFYTYSGDDNTFLGYGAGHENSSGSANTFIGHEAGYAVTTGTNNIVIGYGQAASATNNSLNLGGLIYGTNMLAGGNGGRVGIGIMAPATTLEVLGRSRFTSGASFSAVDTGWASSSGYGSGNWGVRFGATGSIGIVQGAQDSTAYPLALNPYGGNVAVGSAAAPGYTLTIIGTAWVTSGAWTGSDRRWKKDIMPLENSLDKILRLQGVTYNWRTKEFPELRFSTATQLGLIAQDTEKIVPEAVTTDNNGYKGISYERLVPVLIEAVKEQQKQLESLKEANKELRKMVAGAAAAGADSAGGVPEVR